MICRVFDHQNKSAKYKEALANAGYRFTERQYCQGVRFFLSDADWRTDMMEEAREKNIPVFLYPHAARPMVQYDGCVEPKPVRAMFTQAPGGVEIMKRIGYPYPVEVSGWAYSDVKPFRPVKDVKRILYAPIHPNANGYLHEVDKDLNCRTLERLTAYCHDRKIQLSVRYIDEPEKSGLRNVSPDVEMHRGKKNNTTFDMETADVVVAHQTFAYMAVALGIPTVMMGEDVPPRSGNTEEGFCYVQHWDDYKDDLMFPLDILQGETEDVIQAACEGSEAVEAWKAKYIGEPFDGPAFVKKLESYL